jgi:hypothetical protein
MPEERNVEPVSALKTSAAAVSLVSALTKLIQQNKSATSTPPHSLQELLGRLQPEAVCISRDLENRLRVLVERISEYGLNPTLSLEQQLQNLYWYNFITRSRLKSFREECTSIYRRLTEFIDDATALLICQGNQQGASTAFIASLETKRELDQLFLNQNLPLKDLLDKLLSAASQATSDLLAA